MNAPPNREVALFSAALELDASQRSAYLDQACADDPALRSRLDALLGVHQKAITFLEAPAREAQASPVGAEVTGGPAAHPSSPSEKAGDRIGRYKLLQQIGEGGCGVVYMAEQEEPVRRRVALKVIKLGMDTRQVIARFEAERQALALMDHPNIAKVLDAGATETGRPFFVMELVRGIKITDYCDENNLSTEERLKLFTQVCQAIQHAHQKGIIHRDIKPSNILVTVNEPGAPGCPKVIDFGIAKATSGQRLTEKTVFTAFEQFIGTPAYMSPEQATMTALEIDTRTDIYALGVLLYELLTGKTPLDQKDLLAAGLEEMRRTIREKEPIRPSTRLSTMLEGELTTTAKHRHTDPPKLILLLRGDLDWIVMKALEKDRARRYETANGMAMDVQRYLADEPVVARPPSRLYRFQKMARRNKLAFAAATAIATALSIGAGVSTWQAIRATRATREQTRLLLLAESKGKKSEQLARLLQDMLKGVGPSVALGRDTILLQEILDLAAERMVKDLTNQPEVEVELGLTLAETYRDLALYEPMEKVARHSLQLARARLGEENESVANSLISLGEAVRHLGQKQLGVIYFGKREQSEIDRRRHNSNLIEAEKYCREGLAMSRKLLGNENPTVANGLYQVGSVLEVQYRMAEAETMFRDALALLKKTSGHDQARVAKVLYQLALVLAYQDKRLAEAETLIREALGIQRKLLHNDHPEIANSLYILAIVLSLQERWPEGESRFREVLAIWQKLQANERPEYPEVLHNLGYVLMQQGKLAEAETRFSEALALRKKWLGSEHPDVVDSLHKLAMMAFQQGRVAEAEKICREELTLQRKLRTNDCFELAGALNNLGYLLMVQDKLADAEAMLLEAVAMGRRLISSENLERGLAFNNLAKVYQLQGKLAEAEATHQELLTIQRKVLGNESSYVVDVLNQLAGFLVEQGRPAEARPLVEESAAIWLRHPEQAEFLQVYRPLRHLLTVLGDTAGVEAMNTQLLPRFRKNAEGGDAGALNDLAWFLAACPDPKFRNGTNAVVYAEKAVAATNRKNFSCLDTLAAAYAETGQFAKAIRIAKEALALPHHDADESAVTSRLKLYESNSPYREAD